MNTSQIIIGEETNVDVDTSEETVVEVTDLSYLNETQLSIYLTTVLGTHTSMEYRFYYLPSVGGTYAQKPKWNATDNTIDDYPAIINADSPNPCVFEFGLGSCFGFKITAKGVGGANGSASARIMARNN